jgi:hypothetical protein
MPPVYVPPHAPQARGRSAVVAIVSAIVVAGALGYGVVASRSRPTPSPPTAVTAQPLVTAQPTLVTAQPTLDCSQAQHPPQGSEARKAILDALRRHAHYDGLYTVQFVTVLHDWAYLEAAPFDQAQGQTVGEFRGYVTRWDGHRWNWRWEGGTGAEADGPGDPPYPSDFRGPARDVLRC